MVNSPVYVRLRPSDEDQLVQPAGANIGLTVNNEFFVDSTTVLTNSSQEDTFKKIGIPLVEDTLKGFFFKFIQAILIKLVRDNLV